MTTHRARNRRAAPGGVGILACALTLAASGCGGSGGPSAAIRTQASATLADHLTLSLSEDKTSLKAGDTVTYTITLTNPTAAPITSIYSGYAGSGPVTLNMLLIPDDSGSFHVQDPGGSLITRDGTVSGYPPIVPPLPVTVMVQPGQSLSATEIYTLTRPGVYSASAALQTSDSPATPAAGPLTVTVH